VITPRRLASFPVKTSRLLWERPNSMRRLPDSRSPTMAM
jgi:hypothetical protein